MSSIDDLRRTLTDHADHVALHDDGLATRASAVAHRVRVVRRRRRAALAATAAAVVVVAGATTLLPSRQDEPPAAATVVGVDIPQTMQSLGRTYTYDHRVEAESGRASVELEESDVPRLVSWATQGSDQRVSVSASDAADPSGFVSEQPDFTDFTLVPDGAEWEVDLAADGPLGVAVYELSEDAPGVSRDGVAFRDHVADRRLLAATIGEKGQNEVSVTFTAGEGRHYVSDWCSSSWNGKGGVAAWATIEIDDGGSFGSSCQRTEGFADPGAASSGSDETATGLPADVRPGDEVTVTLRLTREFDGEELVEDDRAQLGLAVYEGPRGRTTAAGEIPETVEHDGHRWRLHSVQEGSIATGEPMLVSMPSGRKRFLVGFHVADIQGSPQVQLAVDGHAGSVVQYDADGALGGSAIGGYATPGTGSAKLTARGGSAAAAIVRYELMD